jgi:hypothetical protein
MKFYYKIEGFHFQHVQNNERMFIDFCIIITSANISIVFFTEANFCQISERNIQLRFGAICANFEANCFA